MIKRAKVVSLAGILLLCAFVFVSARNYTNQVFAADSTQQQIYELEGQLSGLKNEASQLKKQLDKANSNLKNTENEIAYLDQETSNLETQIKVLDQLLVQWQGQSKQLEEEIAQLEQDKQREQNIFDNMLRMSYQYGNDTYMNLIFGSESVSDLISRIDLIVYHLKYNNNVIENAESPFMPVEDEVYADKGFFDELVHAECPKNTDTYLLTNLRYPMSAVDAGVVGTVNVSFIVEEDGTISNVDAKESVYPDLTKEAVRVVQNMEKWKPAMLNGTPVRSKFHVPLLFTYDTPGFYIPPKNFDCSYINIPEDEDLYFVRVEKNAEYPEGKMALFEYLKQNLGHIKISSSSEKEIFHYDQINDLIRNRVWTGDTLNPNRPLNGHKIYDEYNTPIDTGAFHEIPVEFIVEKSGFLSNVKVYESDSSIHDEILRVVKKMPKWKPATIRDTVVRSRYILPVLFKIDN